LIFDIEIPKLKSDFKAFPSSKESVVGLMREDIRIGVIIKKSNPSEIATFHLKRNLET
jgi:hypothetical protein